MKKTMSVLLAGAIAVAGLGLSTVSGEARHRDRDRDFHFGLYLGGPSYGYQPYRHRYYAPPRRYYAPPPRRAYRGGMNAHVSWCYNRYRSYRAWDNTFQPYNGPRQLCYSPYWG
jgi:hypothetical protein